MEWTEGQMCKSWATRCRAHCCTSQACCGSFQTQVQYCGQHLCFQHPEWANFCGSCHEMGFVRGGKHTMSAVGFLGARGACG